MTVKIIKQILKTNQYFSGKKKKQIHSDFYRRFVGNNSRFSGLLSNFNIFVISGSLIFLWTEVFKLFIRLIITQKKKKEKRIESAGPQDTFE